MTVVGVLVVLGCVILVGVIILVSAGINPVLVDGIEGVPLFDDGCEDLVFLGVTLVGVVLVGVV